MIRLEHSRLVRAPKQKVYDWWIDFQETDPSLLDRIIRRRKIVSKSASEVVYEDEGRMRVTMIGLEFSSFLLTNG